MESNVIYIFLAAIFSGGGFYAATNFRLRSLEEKMKSQNDLKDTLTRLDERVSLLINHFIKEIK